MRRLRAQCNAIPSTDTSRVDSAQPDRYCSESSTIANFGGRFGRFRSKHDDDHLTYDDRDDEFDIDDYHHDRDNHCSDNEYDGDDYHHDRDDDRSDNEHNGDRYLNTDIYNDAYTNTHSDAE